jgi:rod shape determining protein RodA
MYPIFALAILNLLMLWGLDKTYFWRQLVFWGIGLLIYYLVKKANLPEIIKRKNFLYLFILLLLFLPFLIGQVVRGSARWLQIGDFSLQPSELAKPLLILFYAKHLTSYRLKIGKNFIFSLIFMILPVGLILMQPDLGSAAIILFSLLFMVWLKFPHWKWWLPIFGLGILTLVLGPRLLLHDYQMDRITSFLNPAADPLGKGYNLIQAKLAVGSGGLFGRGFGQGRQTQLAFLPEKHTDFIFAALGEELGFIGIVFTLGFYFWLFWYLLKQINQTQNEQRYLLRLGIFVQLFIQAIINIAMNLQLFPVVGLPLPLLSYGGSSLLSTLLSLALF